MIWTYFFIFLLETRDVDLVIPKLFPKSRLLSRIESDMNKLLMVVIKAMNTVDSTFCIDGNRTAIPSMYSVQSKLLEIKRKNTHLLSYRGGQTSIEPLKRWEFEVSFLIEFWQIKKLFLNYFPIFSKAQLNHSLYKDYDDDY